MAKIKVLNAPNFNPIEFDGVKKSGTNSYEFGRIKQ